MTDCSSTEIIFHARLPKGHRFKKSSQLKGRLLEAVLEVRSGTIRRARLTDPAPGGSRIPDLEAVLTGRRPAGGDG